VASEVLAVEAAGFELLSVFEACGRVKKATELRQLKNRAIDFDLFNLLFEGAPISV